MTAHAVPGGPLNPGGGSFTVHGPEDVFLFEDNTLAHVTLESHTRIVVPAPYCPPTTTTTVPATTTTTQPVTTYCPAGCEWWPCEHELADSGDCNAVEWFEATGTPCDSYANKDRVPLRDGPVDVWWDGDGWIWAYPETEAADV